MGLHCDSYIPPTWSRGINCLTLLGLGVNQTEHKHYYNPGVYLFSHSVMAARRAALISGSVTSSIPLNF